MAYMDQSKKARIAAALRQIMPSDWRYSLAVQHHSTIVMTIKQAPIDLIGEIRKAAQHNASDERAAVAIEGHCEINEYHYHNQFPSGSAALPVIEKVIAALRSADYYDRSDSATDYFDCAYFYRISVGRWDKPFLYVAPKSGAASSRTEEKQSPIVTQAAPQTTTPRLMNYRCSKCGGHDVGFDAVSAFNVASQSWELSHQWETSRCEQCGDVSIEGYEMQGDEREQALPQFVEHQEGEQLRVNAQALSQSLAGLIEAFEPFATEENALILENARVVHAVATGSTK